MKKQIKLSVGILVLLTAVARGDTFGTGTNQFSMEFVDIGFLTNEFDSITGYGKVNYAYRIGKYEVSIDQFTKADAADDRIGNGNENFWNDGFRSGGTNAPAARVSWIEAAKFCNWLTSSNAYAGAYLFDTNGVLTGVDRPAAAIAYGTVYLIPSEDEWYKAAFFTLIDAITYALYSVDVADIATLHGTPDGLNFRLRSEFARPYPDFIWEARAGGEERGGTRNMLGNVSELLESAWDGELDDINEYRVRRGGEYGATLREMISTNRLPISVEGELSHTGLRVASVTVIETEIDIWPGNVNVISPEGMDACPVALYGSAVFDIDAVDHESVTLEGAEPLSYDLVDSNGDGYADIVYWFRMNEMEVEVDDEYAILSGTFFGGQIFYGMNEIVVNAPNAPGWDYNAYLLRLLELLLNE